MEGSSHEDVAVNISADGGSQVSTPVLSNVHVCGNVSFSNYISGVQQPAPTQDSDQHSKITEYKTSVLDTYEFVQEYNSLPEDEDVLLENRYTELLIIQRSRSQERDKEKEEELRSMGEILQNVYQKRATETHRRITLDQLFRSSERGPMPKAVIVQGHSGHGKSFTIQKIMHNWASGLLFEDFILVFHLNCKELSLLSGDHSVVDLLTCDQTFTSVILKILQDSPGKVLFLIDGFDELSLNESASVSLRDPSVRAPIGATLSSLLKGNVLSQSFVLVTTRSTVSDKLSEQLKRPQRFTEILGFSEDGVKEYFHRFFEDRVLSDKVYDCVRANETLFTSCFVPVICWIVCTVFREHFQESADAQGDFETTSSIFMHFIYTLISYHCESSRQLDLTILKNLGQLAEQGMQKHQVLFDERTVSEVLPHLSVRNPFLCKFLMRKKIYRETMYSFMHLSFQEFFAALQYFLTDEVKEACQKLQMLLPSLKEMDFFKQIKENGKDRVLLFIFGLSNSDVWSFVKSGSVAAIRAQLKEWLLKVAASFCQYAGTLFILHCLYEIHERDFVMQVIESMGGSIEFRTHRLQRIDYWVLLYCLQCSPSISSLSLGWLTAENLRMLRPVLYKCEELRFDVEDLLDSDVDDLILALGEGKVIHELSIINCLTSESVTNILSALHKQRCVGYILFQRVKAITLDIALMSLDLIQTTPEHKWGNSIWMSENYKIPNEKDSLCMLVSVSKNATDLSLTLGWGPDTEDSDFSLALCLTLPSMDIININNFKEYLQKCPTLKENHTADDDHVEALFSSLHSVTDMKELRERVRYLTLGQTLGRLSLHTFPNLKRVTMSECKKWIDCTTLSFERAESNRMDTVITYGSKITVNFVSIRLSASLDMARYNLTDFILTFDAYLMEYSRMNHADSDDVEAPLSSLCSAPGLKTVEVEVYSATLSLAAGSFCLLQTHPSVQTVKVVESNMQFSIDDNKSDLCSSLCITKDTSPLCLRIEIAAGKLEAMVSFISLSLSQSSVKTFDLKDLLLKFRTLRHSSDRNSPHLDEHNDILISSLHSLPGLREVHLKVDCLNISWAKRILSLIQSCPTLQKLDLLVLNHLWTGNGFIFTDGFLKQEAIHLLQTSQIHPDCTVILKGWLCRRTPSQCSGAKDWHLSCNQQMVFTLKGRTRE